MKKVIAFSLWGPSLKYSIGAIKNAKLAAELFPDWECWFYFPTGEDMRNMDALVHAGVVLMGMPNASVIDSGSPGDWRMMFDRFKPALDPTVDVFISRDCDSRLSLREKEAVDEWLASPKGFHIMRDHPWHGAKILGGMWGMKRDCLPEFGQLLSAWKAEDRWQTDQDFLASEIYPRVVNNALVHDPFFDIPIEDAQPFPDLRNGLEFVGQVFDQNDVTVSEHQEILRRALKGRGERINPKALRFLEEEPND